MERLKARTEEILSEYQGSVGRSRSTTNQVFTLEQLAEKCTNLTRDLCIHNVVFRNVFDGIWREGLWKIIRHLGYQDTIVRMLEICTMER